MVGRSRNIIKGGGGGGGARGGSHHEFMNANFAFHKSLNKCLYFLASQQKWRLYKMSKMLR